MQHDPKPLIIDNILLSGYLRESFADHVPNLVSNLIHRYSRQLRVLHNRAADHDDPIDTLQWMLQNSLMRKIYSDSSDQTSIPKGAYDCGPVARKDHIVSRDIQAIHNTFSEHWSDRIIDIKTGSAHVLILTAMGCVYAMGQNDSGECGMGDALNYIKKPAPIQFEQGRKITAIATGRLHSLFVDQDGQLLVCGYNYCGQLGMTNNNISSIDAEFSIAESGDEDGHVEDGDIDCDEFEESTDRSLIVSTPTLNEFFIENGIEVTKVYCGSYHSLCITTKGECYSFGHNGHGNLGNGTKTEWGEGQWTPQRLSMPSDDSFVNGSCGADHNLLVTANNQVVAFGDNTHRQCSSSAVTSITEPLVLSKEEEFGIPQNYFVDEVICLENRSLIMVDEYKRIQIPVATH